MVMHSKSHHITSIIEGEFVLNHGSSKQRMSSTALRNGQPTLLTPWDFIDLVEESSHKAHTSASKYHINQALAEDKEHV